MPIYEFKCQSCGRVFDLLVLKPDQAEMKCPDCGCPEVTKLMSAANHAVSGGSCCPAPGNPSVSSRSCGSGSCTTLDIPGGYK